MTPDKNITTDITDTSYSYSSTTGSYRTPEEIIESHVAFNTGLPNERKPSRQRKPQEFRGYTLEEIRYRRLVNRLKIDIAQERLRMTFSRQTKKEETAISGAVNSFQTVMRFVDIAMVAFGITRRVSSFFRKFSRNR